MSLITTIQELQKYVRVAYTSQQTATMPNMDIAEEDYLLPVLGKTVFAALADTNNTGEEWQRLRELCKRVIAPLAIAGHLARKQITISDIGLHSTTKGDLVPSSRWAFMELRTALQDDGAKALEALWQFLYDNAAALNWTSPLPEQTLFKTGKAFSDYFFISQPHRIFQSLVPEIIQVQEHYLHPAFGAEFIARLRDSVNSTTKEKAALTLLRLAAANLTIYKACLKLAVTISTAGFTILMGDSGDMPTKGQQDSSWTEKQALQVKSEEDGLRYIAQLKDYLYKNVDDFADFKNSPYYKPPQPGATDPNSKRNGVFAL